MTFSFSVNNLKSNEMEQQQQIHQFKIGQMKDILDMSKFEPHNLFAFNRKFMLIFNSFNGSFINLTIPRELKLKHYVCTKSPTALYLSMVSVIKHGGQHLMVLIVIRKCVFVAMYYSHMQCHFHSINALMEPHFIYGNGIFGDWCVQNEDLPYQQ